MGADEQRFSLIAQFFQNRRILHPGARIQPGSRFIQDQKIRIVDERPRQTEALLHASRKPVHEKVLFIFQPHLFQKRMAARPRLQPRNSVAGCKKFHIFRYFQVIIYSEEIRHIADPPPEFFSV